MTARKNTPALGTKAAEIEMLSEIFSLDGYLADSLENQDLEIMTTNIKNDFPIFFNTSIDQSARIARLQDLNIELENKLIAAEYEKQAKNNMIICLDSDLEAARSAKKGIILQAIKSDALYLVEDFCTANEVLRIKLEHGLELTERERKALLSLVS